MPKILIVEDEPEIREMIRFALEPKGFLLSEADNAQDARKLLADHSYDLILMDWMLPGRSGLELTKELKQISPVSTPIILLTAKTDEADKVIGLDSGADDYITKPFSTREMIARINAVLRRSGGSAKQQAFAFHGLTLDPVKHLVMTDENPLHLSPAEYNLLFFFMSHPERVYSRSQILDHVWGNDVYVDERTVDVHIRRLRKLLTPSNHHRFIQTVRGVGYRFTPQPASDKSEIL
ncbi:MAG: phosphate regulon transcriptional regulator PhoB [Candidatus Thiodiazotropha taylori]|uniref:Phosphate regulon transcriptional regulatory protein PhoB n=1 Tax=Candidatus Thiodiazotropha taylori TaxID=2792791 RepID=A0A9E4U2M4_9GAMM|nr:phosphate regulon transcriptional regulator PhoB [Candidatus Thiodiazotropha taylori]MCG7948606.1 phosphate regulon transcriptional regulator PhoB [Candidatus Thiodiazotropha taylori]MCG7965626.1 phosphate regulon transcriptional regulator PhoB [Candidatus Thiodiazotropha taylori]MCG8027056.1 phosphate regulon transcriptional regulator PhoB [Candidatus Thiodiazotropha taylori]MCG8051612.1 phosphate regulon transcriptional regulator PhoB [Candidatus Thiodiazotropha taylori]